MATKITPRAEPSNKIVVRTRAQKTGANQAFKWWEAGSKRELCQQILDTVGFLKEQQQFRYRQAGVYARLYGNMPLFNVVGSDLMKMNSAQGLPLDRPTMNVVQSCIDTLVSRITQAKPYPRFLTDNGDYKQRKLAKQLNNFIGGEFYRTETYKKAALILRDAAVLGTGCVKTYEDNDKKVALERVLLTELLVDPNDALYGNPRQLFQLKLIDRSVLAETFPDYRSDIQKAQQAFPDNSADAQKTASDQVMVAECWHLPSGDEAGDGRHSIVCSSGVIFDDEDWNKKRFPFTFLHYNPRMLGFWGQGLAEQLMGTQVQINKILIQMSKCIDLITPVWMVEDSSKMVKAHFSNALGRIQTYQGTLPQYFAPEPYNQILPQQLERLVQFAYQQSGVSALSAAAQKPAGLNSGEAIRNYDDLQSDRFAALDRRYQDFFIELAYQDMDLAQDIAKREGSYETVYPSKDGARQINLPDFKNDEDANDPFVIQCFDTSSLPREPAGRVQAIIERMQAGLISQDEGRRLLGDLDLEQYDKLANAAEERVLQILDEIVEEGKYTPPDPFMTIPLAEERVVQYYNLYMSASLSEDRAQKLRDFFSQIQALKQASQPPAPVPGAPGAAGPIGQPIAPPQSDLMPIAG